MSAQTMVRRAQLDLPLARYERMVEIRHLEETIHAMFAAGEVHGSTHLCQGQEALAVGLASVLRRDDLVTATYRGHGIALALGMEPETLLREVLGREGGCTGGVGGSMHLCDPEIGLLPTFAIVGAGLPVACGAALAMQTLGEDRIAATVFGDGASNIGAFHESLNLASIWKLPVLFVIDNNVYGEYSRWNVTTPVEHLVERASSYGMVAAQVDGMDVDLVRSALATAVEHVRSEQVPYLIEAKTYRFAGHSRSDTALYRPAGELDAWRLRDPLTLTKAALIASGVAESTIDRIENGVAEAIRSACDSARSTSPVGRAAMFAHVTQGSLT